MICLEEERTTSGHATEALEQGCKERARLEKLVKGGWCGCCLPGGTFPGVSHHVLFCRYSNK